RASEGGSGGASAGFVARLPQAPARDATSIGTSTPERTFMVVLSQIPRGPERQSSAPRGKRWIASIGGGGAGETRRGGFAVERGEEPRSSFDRNRKTDLRVEPYVAVVSAVFASVRAFHFLRLGDDLGTKDEIERCPAYVEPATEADSDRVG